MQEKQVNNDGNHQNIEQAKGSFPLPINNEENDHKHQADISNHKIWQKIFPDEGLKLRIRVERVEYPINKLVDGHDKGFLVSKFINLIFTSLCATGFFIHSLFHGVWFIVFYMLIYGFRPYLSGIFKNTKFQLPDVYFGYFLQYLLQLLPLRFVFALLFFINFNQLTASTSGGIIALLTSMSAIFCALHDQFNPVILMNTNLERKSQ